MIYEYRTYTVLPGKMRDLHERFTRVVFPTFEKHDMKPIGAWTPVIGGRSDQFMYILAYQDLAHREKGWAEFQADKDWVQEMQKGGGMIAYEESMIMKPTNFSPLK